MAQLREVNPARSWSRVDGIDLLRGLAIFFVLMNHVNMQLLFAHVPYTRGLPKQLVSSLVWNGQQGVQIFFAVSGFLITATSLRRWKSLAQVSIADFYRLRFARIAPLLLGLLAILSVLHVTHVKHFVVSPQTGGLGHALFAALTFHVNWLEASRGYLPGNWDILWSLSVEETFYLAFPLGVPLVWPWQAAHRAPAGVCCARAIRAVGADAWQPGMAGVFVSRRHGCDRDGVPDRDCAP
jgi:peptidoglycan/LPS O-acetylase OafA/YrhL